MEKIAVFPGSFDPITTGHVDLVRRALPLFDKIIVAVGVNTTKKYLFSLEQRLEWLRQVFAPYRSRQKEIGVGKRRILKILHDEQKQKFEKMIEELQSKQLR